MTARVALVTGAARGIGRVIAADLGQDHDIAFTYLTTDPGAVLGQVPQALAIKADMTASQKMADVVAEVIARFGRLDVIVNNAGTVAETAFGASDHAPHQAVLNANLIGPMALLDAALPHLQSGAVVINISSVNATFPPISAPAYGASKAALDNWTRAAAKALGPKGIRVVGVAPGAIEREESPRPPELVELFVKDTALGRVGRPEDIASVVRFMASEAAGFITGETVVVSGGYRL